MPEATPTMRSKRAVAENGLDIPLSTRVVSQPFGQDAILQRWCVWWKCTPVMVQSAVDHGRGPNSSLLEAPGSRRPLPLKPEGANTLKIRELLGLTEAASAA